MPFSVYAALVGDDGGFYYDVNTNGTATIEEYYGRNQDLIVPGEIYSNVVTSISNSTFSYNKTIESVVIANSIDSVGTYAFYCCENLKSVLLSNSLTKINSGTFGQCISLERIYIPSSVISIANNSFNGCNNVTIIAEPDTTAAEYAETKGLPFVDINSITTDNNEISQFKGARVLLEPDSGIGLAMYMKFSKAIIESPTAVMRITAPNGNVEEVSIMKDAEITTVDGDNCYKFICHTAAKEMTDNVTMQVIDGDTVGEVYSYSVKEYANELLSQIGTNQEYAEAETLVRSMLIYGAESQKYFGYNTDNIATDVTVPDEVMIPEEWSGVNPIDDDFTALGLEYYGSSLVLKSKTSYVIYFEPKDNYNGATMQFIRDGEIVTVEPTIKNGLVRYEITGIEAGDLEKNIDVTIGENAYKLNPGIYFVLARDDDEIHNQTTLANVVKSLYYYNMTAESYKSLYW